MTIYYFIILGLLGLGYVLTEKRKERNKTFCYLSISCFVLTFFASFRYAIGFDYFSYQDIYEKIKEGTFGDILSYKQEPLFFIVCRLFGKMGCSFSIFLFGVNLFLFFVAMRFIYQESKMPWISVYLYSTLQFLAYNMNLVRQSIAVAFFILAYPYLKNRRVVPFTVFIVLGGLFHNSLFFLSPFYYLLPKKHTKKSFLWTIVLTISVYFLCDPIIQIIEPFLPGRYKEYLLSYFWSPNSFVYVLPPLGYFICIYSFCKQIKDTNLKTIYFNSAFYYFIISLFITKHFILERFSIYPFTLSFIAIPEIIVSYQKKEYKKRYPQILILFLILGGIYFFFAAAKGYHHVYPYISLLQRSHSIPNR